MEITDSYSQIFKDKNVVMVVLAHPDDTEIFCGGLIARLKNDGKKVVSVKMTCGEKGSREKETSQESLKQLRIKEDSDSMKSLGISEDDSVLLDLGDGSVETDLDTVGKVAFLIRKYRPDIVITHNPENVIISYAKNENWVNHRDHLHTGKVVVDAVYPYSRDLLFFPEHFSEPGVISHKVTEMLMVDYYNHEDEKFFDVSDFMQNRIGCLICHSSQYTEEHAHELADFMTKESGGRRYERFRYVLAD